MSTILRTAIGGTVLAGGVLAAGCHPQAGANASTMAGLPDNAMGPVGAGSAAAALPGLPASLPLQGGPATAQAAAPAVSRLPAAPRPALRQLGDPQAGYAYLDRAASYDEALGGAPPDYAFGYGGVTPWGWQADDGSVEYAEPIEGGYRYYYYEPGADTPYLVRDPSYSYAFDAAALVVVYDRAGRMMPRGAYGPRWDYAGRFLARARALHGAAQVNRQQVLAANWAARRDEVAASSAAWSAVRARDAAWAAYHVRAAGRERAHWQGERDARAQATQHFADFQRQDYAPPRAGQPGRAAAAQPLAVPAAALPNRQPLATPQRQAVAAARPVSHLVATGHLAGATPAGPSGAYPPGEPRVVIHRPPEGSAARPSAVQAEARERRVAVHAEREAAHRVPRLAVDHAAAVRHDSVTIHREQAAPEHGRDGRQHGSAEPHAAPPLPAPRTTPPHAETPRHEAPRAQPPHVEAPHPAPAPHPAAAAPHGPPGGGGHEHH